MIAPHKVAELKKDLLEEYEYAAAGLPTVGTPLEEYSRAGLPVSTGKDADEMSARIRKALGVRDAEREALREFARGHTWDRRFRRGLESLGEQ